MKKEYEPTKPHEKLYFRPSFWEKHGYSGSISMSNCLDDPELCSIVGIQWKDLDELGFLRVVLNKEEVERVIEALQEIRKDMDLVKETVVEA